MAPVLASRSVRTWLFRLDLLSDKPLIAVVCSTILFQFALIYLQALQTFTRSLFVRLILPWRSLSLPRFSALSKWRNGCSVIPTGLASEVCRG